MGTEPEEAHGETPGGAEAAETPAGGAEAAGGTPVGGEEAAPPATPRDRDLHHEADDVTDAAPEREARGGEAGRVTRSAAGTDTPSTLRPDVVELYFQVYPGTRTREGTNIGIPNVPYTITIPGLPEQRGNTDSDGKIRISLMPGTTATVRVFDTEYRVTARNTLEPVEQRPGLQRRLQMLGYNLGPAGVDGRRGRFTEKAVLDFQADAGLRIDGIPGRRTRTTITGDDWVGE